MLLRKAVELFLGEYKPTTRRSHFYTLRPMQDYLGPARPIESLRVEHVLEYSQTLRERGLADASIRKHFKTIKAFFNWLVKLGLLAESPARVLKSPPEPTAVDRSKAMSDDEYAALLDFVKWKPRDHALILFLADTGCRAGGAAHLKLDDLDLENLRAAVTEKGEKTRPVAYGEECRRALRIWLFKRPRTAGIYVFSRTHQPLTANTVSQIIYRNCLRCGIRPLGSHSLRHRKGHQFADAKIAVSIAATALGHSDPAITARYYYPRDWATAEHALRELATPAAERPRILKLGSNQ